MSAPGAITRTRLFSRRSGRQPAPHSIGSVITSTWAKSFGSARKPTLFSRHRNQPDLSSAGMTVFRSGIVAGSSLSCAGAVWRSTSLSMFSPV